MRWLGAVALAVALAGCGDDEFDEAACEPKRTAIAQSTILEGAGGWAFGQAPAYVAFLDLPMYRAAERGDGSFVAIYRDQERNGGYSVKLMTIVQPPFAGAVREEIAAVTPGRQAGFGLGSASDLPIERLEATRTLNVRPSDDLIAGSLVFSGPGCYPLALEADGRRFEFAFPVAFAGFEPAQ